MAYTVFRHKVADYAAWRKVFDDFLPTRREAGERSAIVLRTEGDPNEVTVVNSWDSVSAARAFISREDLKDAMVSAGVQGAPDILIANEA